MAVSTQSVPVISSIHDVGLRYSAWLVDIWGVMHNGVRPFGPAVEATRRFREQGGVVLLLSNSPRPSETLRQQLRTLGVADQSYDATVSSGDLTRYELKKRDGARVFHLGPKRDLLIFTGLNIARVDASQAELIVCTGLFDDETETPDDYRGLLGDLAERGLMMFCANPDHMVERGDSLIYCAGALADLYEQLGGRAIYAGKPHLPIYKLAFETIEQIAGRPVPKGKILAIGDGLHTDIAGAAAAGIDSVFVASALHLGAEGGGERIRLDDRSLEPLFRETKPPIAAIPALAWA
jgi:HAD superfamily hydrolase (TIGR01459 family)